MALTKWLGLAAILIVSVTADGYDDEESESYHPKKRTVTTTEVPKTKCYQCSYSPGKTVYKEKEFVKKVHDRISGKYKIIREKKLVPEKQVGGWDKCGGTFSKYDAQGFGIDTWECKYNCMVRVDKAGNLFRGCYRGEFGVDPYNTKDIQEVGDSQYKFCHEPLCNSYNLEFV